MTNGGPGEARTPNPCVRSAVLYPVELRVRSYETYPMLTFARTGIPVTLFYSQIRLSRSAQFLYRISPKLLYLDHCAFYCACSGATIDSESTT